MQWIVCYDIHDNRRRRQACKILRSVSHGYQDSAFECNIQRDPQLLFHQLYANIDTDDSFIITQHPQVGPDWYLGKAIIQNTSTLLIFD